MNKGLEMIETQWLFHLPPEKIEVVIHPQSLIHCIIEFIDGSMLCQLNEPDMVLPIQYALTYPERRAGLLKSFDFVKNGRLDFFIPDYERFPALLLAQEAMRTGGSLPCFMNASNEILVNRFLNKEISWNGILSKLEKLMNTHHAQPALSLDLLLEVDKEARLQALIA